MKPLSRLTLSILALALVVSPLAAQKSDQAYQWYWGGQGGAFGYKTNLQTLHFDPILGGHWLITAKKTALYLSYEQAFFSTPAVAEIADANSSTGLRNASFSNVRRIMIGVIAMPVEGHLQPLVGGGFAIVQILNPTIDCSGGSPNSVCAGASDSSIAQQAASNAASKAFVWAMAGLQINFGRLGIFGQAFATSSAQEFMLDGPTFTIQGGLRYSLGSSKEDITEQN